MKKKLFVFLTVIFGGLFILLYNPLKELASSSGEVKAAETYSELEKFLMSEESGSYTLTQDETITHDLNLSFTTETIKTIATIYLGSTQGPERFNLTLAADIIVGNNCVLKGFNFISFEPSNGGEIILKGNGTLSVTPNDGSFNLGVIRCDSDSIGSIYVGEGPTTGVLGLNYGVNFRCSSTGIVARFEKNFSGSVTAGNYSTFTISTYLGQKNKIKIQLEYTSSIPKINLIDTKFDLVKNEEENAFYLVRKGINFIPKPTESTTIYTYNGESQEYIPNGFDESTMNITNNVQINAGTYDVTVTFKDTYGWDDGSVDPIIFTFTIKKAELTLTLTVKDQLTTYSGRPANPTNNYTKEVSGLKGMDHIDVVTIGGTAVYKYSSGSYTTNTVAPTNVGNYVIGLSGLTATADNYTITTVKYIDGVLTIEPKEVTVEFSNYENLVYNKGEQEITVNLKGVFENDTCTVTGITGNKEKNAGDYTCEVTALSNSNYALSGTTTLGWSIAKYQVEKPKEDTTVYTYTGEEQTYQVEASEFYTVSNQTQREAGTYKVIITLNDTDNCEWEDETIKELEYSFTIRQKAVDIIWSENTFTYNGEEQDKSGIKAYYLSLPSSTKNYLTVKCNSESFKLANTYTFTVELDDTKNYTVANSSDKHSYTITKAVYHDITCEEITVEYKEGLTLKDVSLKPGFSFKNPETVLVVDTIKKYDAIYNEDPDNYEDYELKIQVRVIYKKEDPEILTIPEATELTYGETLESSILSNGLANVEGNFSWSNPTQDAETGNLEYEVTFTPADTKKYNAITFKVNVRVKKAIPEIITLPEATDILVGQNLDKSSLASGTASVEGSFSWVTPNTIASIGENSYEVVFTPKDTTNYEEVVFEVPMKTEKLSTSENGSIEVNKDNYEELKEIVDNYNGLTEEEKNKLDTDVKEEIQRIEKAIQEYEGGNNLATVLILSIGVPCGVILIAGIILYIVIRRKRKR